MRVFITSCQTSSGLKCSHPDCLIKRCQVDCNIKKLIKDILVWMSSPSPLLYTQCYYLDNFASVSCKQAAVPLLCQFTFPLCDCNTSPPGDLYLPSQEECLKVSTEICASEWKLAVNSGLTVPNCSLLLPSNSSDYGKHFDLVLSSEFC